MQATIQARTQRACSRPAQQPADAYWWSTRTRASAPTCRTCSTSRASRAIEYAVNAGTADQAAGAAQLRRHPVRVRPGRRQRRGSEGQDGQQLLEDLRHHKLIPPWAIFIMLTSEGAYDKVVSAAELQPTDYILKPFTAEVLNQRIAARPGAPRRHAAGLPAGRPGQSARGDPRLRRRRQARSRATRSTSPACAPSCTSRSRSTPRPRACTARCWPTQPLGWARLGLARALVAPGPRRRTRVELLEELVARQSAPDGRLRPAGALPRGARRRRSAPRRRWRTRSAISPHMVRRLRKLGEVALETGDVGRRRKILQAGGGALALFRIPQSRRPRQPGAARWCARATRRRPAA